MITTEAISGADWPLIMAAVVAVCVLAGLAAIVFFRRIRPADRVQGDSAMLALALNNMTQGVVMFDCDERLVVCNDRYVAMYGLSRNVVKPGCTLLDVIENRKLTGSLDIDVEKYRAEVLAAIKQEKAMDRIVETPDGRAILVVNRPIAGHKVLGRHP